MKVLGISSLDPRLTANISAPIIASNSKNVMFASISFNAGKCCFSDCRVVGSSSDHFAAVSPTNLSTCVYPYAFEKGSSFYPDTSGDPELVTSASFLEGCGTVVQKSDLLVWYKRASQHRALGLKPLNTSVVVHTDMLDMEVSCSGIQW